MNKILVPDWRAAWKWFSVQASALIVIWAALPTDVQVAVVSLLGVQPASVAGVLALLAIVGRLIAQGKSDV